MTPSLLSQTIGTYLMKAATLVADDTSPLQYALNQYQSTTHTLQFTNPKTNQWILHAKAPEHAHHQVYFPGNLQDALRPELINNILSQTPEKSHLFWNYPGQTRYIGVTHFNQLIEAGYQAVKHLIKTGVRAQHITLYGYSLGGGIAAKVARMLYLEGYFVDLTIDRSFSSLCAVISPLLYQRITDQSLTHKQYAKHLPFGTAVVGSAVLGASLGIGLSCLITALGRYHRKTHRLLNWIGSLIGGTVASIGFLTGLFTGAGIGAVLSLQLLFTRKPRYLSLKLPTRLLLNTTTGELTSVKNIRAILRYPQHGDIKIINSHSDEVIHPSAALNTGLGLSRHAQMNPYRITSIWYQKACHYTPLEAEDRLS